MVVLSALEIDTCFSVNVLTGSDGVLRGTSGGHCDIEASERLSIIVAPLVRGCISTLVEQVTTCVPLALASTSWSLTAASLLTRRGQSWHSGYSKLGCRRW